VVDALAAREGPGLTVQDILRAAATGAVPTDGALAALAFGSLTLAALGALSLAASRSVRRGCLQLRATVKLPEIFFLEALYHILF